MGCTTIAGSHPAVMEILRALRIDPAGVMKMTLSCSCDEVVVTTTVRQVSGDDLENVANVVRIHRLMASDLEEGGTDGTG